MHAQPSIHPDAHSLAANSRHNQQHSTKKTTPYHMSLLGTSGVGEMKLDLTQIEEIDVTA